jgi:hypothetical protein
MASKPARPASQRVGGIGECCRRCVHTERVPVIFDYFSDRIYSRGMR